MPESVEIVAPPEHALPEDAAAPALAWKDSAAAARWMKELPLSSVGQAHSLLLGQLSALATASLPARERATIAELARDPIAHLHTELARRFAGRPQPAGEGEREAADQAIALWQALWVHYSACLKPLLEGETELQGVKAKLLQRALYVGKQLIAVHGLARRKTPASLWQELHAYYRLAEMLECTTVAVSDPLVPDAAGLCCFSMYSHALLLALADPYAMSVREIELTDRWLGLWARKLFPYAQQRDTEGSRVIVDLEGESGAFVAPASPAQPRSSLRYGYPAKLASSVRGRIKRIAQGATPESLQLGSDVSSSDAAALLAHLDAQWSSVPRDAQRTKSRAVELASGGPQAAYFRLCGHAFARQDPLGRDNDHPAQYLHSVGGISDFDRRREEAERSWPWEKWYGALAWHEARVRHAGGSSYRWFLDQLVVAREDGRARLGWVARVADEGERELTLTVRMWPGDPKTLVLRQRHQDGTEDPPTPAVLLDESPEEPASLVVLPRAFAPNRVLHLGESGSDRAYRLLSILQRGADFERVAFEAVDTR